MSSLNTDAKNGAPQVETWLAATPGQQSLWWLDNTLAQPECYNVPVLLTINAPLNIAHMQQAVAVLAHRHEIFRTRFVYLDEELRQHIGDDSQLSFSHRSLTETETPETVMAQLASEHFSLSDGPLGKITLLNGDTDKTWLACCFHHIIIDAPSVRIVLYDLLQLYCAIEAHQPLLVQHNMESFLSFALWQSSLLAEPAVTDQYAAVLAQYTTSNTTAGGCARRLSPPLARGEPRCLCHIEFERQ